jgi:hypothetical protein
MAKPNTTPIDPADIVAQGMVDVGLEPDRPNDEYSDKIRFAQSRRQAEVEGRRAQKGYGG